MERIAGGPVEEFRGVEDSFVIQVGREVRIIVKLGEIDDLAATRLAWDVAKKLEATPTNLWNNPPPRFLQYKIITLDQIPRIDFKQAHSTGQNPGVNDEKSSVG